VDGALGNLRVHLRVRYVNCYSGLRAHNLPQVPNVAVVIRETAFAVALRLCLSVTGHLIEKGGGVELVFDTQRFSSFHGNSSISKINGTIIWNFSQTLDSDGKFRYSTLNSTKVDIQCNKLATVGDLIKLTVLVVIDARPKTWNSLSH